MARDLKNFTLLVVIAIGFPVQGQARDYEKCQEGLALAIKHSRDQEEDIISLKNRALELKREIRNKDAQIESLLKQLNKDQ